MLLGDSSIMANTVNSNPTADISNNSFHLWEYIIDIYTATIMPILNTANVNAKWINIDVVFIILYFYIAYHFRHTSLPESENVSKTLNIV